MTDMEIEIYEAEHQPHWLLEEDEVKTNHAPLDIICVPLCDHCIARAKADKDYISVGRITKAKKCYYCDDTDIPLYMCEVEP